MPVGHWMPPPAAMRLVLFSPRGDLSGFQLSWRKNSIAVKYREHHQVGTGLAAGCVACAGTGLTWPLRSRAQFPSSGLLDSADDSLPEPVDLSFLQAVVQALVGYAIGQ